MAVKPSRPTWDNSFVSHVRLASGEERHALVVDPIGDRSEWIVLGANEWIARIGSGAPPVRLLLNTSGARVLIAGVALLAIDSQDERSNPKASVRSPDLRIIPLGRIEEVLNERRLAGLIREVLGGGGIEAGLDLTPSNLPLPTFPKRTSAATGLTEYGLAGAHKRPRSDDFYRQVADLCGQLLATGHDNYAPLIATANSVPVTTVHAWVKEARRRGFMAPSSRAANVRT